MKFFYRWLMNAKSHNMYYEFEKMIRVIEEYNLSNPKEKILINDTTLEIYKSIVDEKVSYNIFYDNMHIRLEITPESRVYSIHLKKQEDAWAFPKSEKVYDYSHPTTQTFRIYAAYDVPVLNITRASGVSYTQGTWDKYAYNTIMNLTEYFEDCTDCAQFNKNYK